ncbi:MAG: hypothetical protein ACP5LW_02845 [Nitrososphaeria archaeon]
MDSKRAAELLKKHKICDRCLRRYIKNAGAADLSEARRNRAQCETCRGIFYSRDLKNLLIRRLSEYDFRTFNVGVRLPEACEEADRSISIELGLVDYVPVRSAASNYFRRYISRKMGVRVSGSPEINVVIEFDGSLKKVIIFERRAIYRLNVAKSKGSRLQASPCSSCGGRGCELCNWTGKSRDNSLESYLLFELPARLSSSMPKIIWPLKDMPELTSSGVGYPVYVIFSSIKRRRMAPLIIDREPVSGIRILSVYSVSAPLSLNRTFTLDVSLCVETSEGCSEELVKSFERAGELTFVGQDGRRTWKRKLELLKDRFAEGCCFIGRMESGINLYSVLSLKSSSRDKKPLNYLAAPGAIKSFTLEIFRASLPD